MSGEWIGKDDPWPTHSRPEAQKALKYARAQGFLFRKTNSHAFGRLRCSDEDDPCEVSIHSTSGAGDGSATAAVVRDLVRKCPHRPNETDNFDAKPDVLCAELSLRMGDCQRLLDAAEELIARDSYQREFEDQLDQSTRDGDEHFNAAVEMEGLAAVAEQQGLAIVAEVRHVDDWPPADGARELIADVLATLEDVEVASAALSVECPEVTEEAQRLRERLDGLL